MQPETSQLYLEEFVSAPCVEPLQSNPDLNIPLL
jgi:hypothetical protein